MRQRRSILISTAAGITAALTGCLDQDENEDDDSTTSTDDAEQGDNDSDDQPEEGDDDATDQTTSESADDEDSDEFTGGADTAVEAVEGFAMAAEAGNFEEMLSYIHEDQREDFTEEDLEQGVEFIDAEEKDIEFSSKLTFLRLRQVSIADQSEFLTEEQFDQYFNEWEQESSEDEPDAEAEVNSLIDSTQATIDDIEESVDAANSQIVGMITRGDPGRFTDENGFEQATLLVVEDRQNEKWFVKFI